MLGWVRIICPNAPECDFSCVYVVMTMCGCVLPDTWSAWSINYCPINSLSGFLMLHVLLCSIITSTYGTRQYLIGQCFIVAASHRQSMALDLCDWTIECIIQIIFRNRAVLLILHFLNDLPASALRPIYGILIALCRKSLLSETDCVTEPRSIIYVFWMYSDNSGLIDSYGCIYSYRFIHSHNLQHSFPECGLFV